VANGRRRKNTFSLLPIFPPTDFTKTFIFSINFKTIFYRGFRPLLTHFLLFLWFIKYNPTSRCNKFSTHSLLIWFWLKISFPFFEIMVLCMAKPQAAQVNEESAPETFLNLTLTQHPCDEHLEPQKMCTCLKVESLWTWYYCIFPNFYTLVILLQVDPAISNEPKTICEGCYEIKDTFIFAWSSTPSVKHYRWLCGPIRQLPFNNKVNYLVRTIRHILNFLQL
jgi:hypothetical protein